MAGYLLDVEEKLAMFPAVFPENIHTSVGVPGMRQRLSYKGLLLNGSLTIQEILCDPAAAASLYLDSSY